MWRFGGAEEGGEGEGGGDGEAEDVEDEGVESGQGEGGGVGGTLGLIQESNSGLYKDLRITIQFE